MKISIFGMGYVGAVSAGCLASEGHEVVGVDPVQTKVDLINAGRTPIIEKDIGDLIASAVESGHLRATTDVGDAAMATEMSLICVGTPSQPNGNLDLSFVRRVCEQIGHHLREKDSFHVVVLRSTMLPGSMRSVVIPTLEQASGKRAGSDFGVCNNPEFLREGTAVYDYFNPPKTVVGETDTRAGDRLVEIYRGLSAPLIRTDLETAEMVKYVDNCWHALKVGFANEVGNVCKAVGTDGHRVMDIFCQDTKLNLSPYYLKPGFAFGGSCLPKDLRAFTYKARTLDLDVPILNSILPSNSLQVERGLGMVTSRDSKKVGVLGFSFKAGTDDLRESPMVEVIERLLGKGYDIRIYDKNVNVARLVGANREYILNHIPHIANLMVDTPEEVLAHAETIVVGNNDPEFGEVLEKMDASKTVVDLVRVRSTDRLRGDYDGICW